MTTTENFIWNFIVKDLFVIKLIFGRNADNFLETILYTDFFLLSTPKYR